MNKSLKICYNYWFLLLFFIMIPSHANDDISTRIFLRRVVVASLVVLFGMVGLFARYGFLQIHQYDKYQINADNNRIKLISNPPSRGYIYTPNGIFLPEIFQFFLLSSAPMRLMTLSIP